MLCVSRQNRVKYNKNHVAGVMVRTVTGSYDIYTLLRPVYTARAV